MNVRQRSLSFTWWRGLLIVAVMGGVGLWFGAREVFSAREKEKTPLIAPPRLHVSALGRLEPRGEVIDLAAPSGTEGACVAKLFVAEGNDVEANTLLATLDCYERRQAAVKEAEAKVQSARARFAQVKAGSRASDIEAQRIAVDLFAEQSKVAERELKRARDLHQQKAITMEEFDAKQWSYNRVMLEHQRASQLLKSIGEVRDTDLNVAEQEITTADALLARANADLAAAEIRAPRAGRVLKIHAHPGERVGENGLLALGDVQHMQAVAEVFEADVPRIYVGMPAEVHLETGSDRIHGVVEEVGYLVGRKRVLSNDPVSDTDARVLEVRVALKPDEAGPVQRMTNARVEVRLLSEPPIVSAE